MSDAIFFSIAIVLCGLGVIGEEVLRRKRLREEEREHWRSYWQKEKEYRRLVREHGRGVILQPLPPEAGDDD